MKIVLYHNPRCSKSRAAHAILEARKLSFEVVEYLNTPFTESILTHICEALDQPANALLRASDEQFRTLQLNSQELDQAQVVELLIKTPSLFQRPVVLVGNRARIGRPPELIESILP